MTTTGHHTIGLPLVRESSTKARRWIETKLGERLDRETLFDAELVVSELVNNAVVHTHSGFLRLELDDLGSAVEIAVVDNDSDMPVMRDQGPEQTSGRGLHIVDALADEWGAEREPKGKRVWARLSA